MYKQLLYILIVLNGTSVLYGMQKQKPKLIATEALRNQLRALQGSDEDSSDSSSSDSEDSNDSSYNSYMSSSNEKLSNTISNQFPTNLSANKPKTMVQLSQSIGTFTKALDKTTTPKNLDRIGSSKIKKSNKTEKSKQKMATRPRKIKYGICLLCNNRFRLDTLSKHIKNNPEHCKTPTQTLQKSLQQNDTCKDCFVKFPGTLEFLSHTCPRLDKNKKKTIYCKVCDVTISKNPHLLINHHRGNISRGTSKHKTNLTKLEKKEGRIIPDDEQYELRII